MGCQTSRPADTTVTLKKKKELEEPKKECASCVSFQYTKDTCALEYWEPIQLLGEGSISSIHLVRKRPQRVNVPYQERVDIMDLACKAAKKTKIDCCGDDEKRDSRTLYVMKSIMKDHIGNDRYLQEMRDEIYTMSCLTHPHIVRVHEAFERKRHIYLIMDHCKGGDLTGRKTIVEAETCHIIQQILSAIAYCHEHKVVHRDLKLENVMFEHDESEVLKGVSEDSILSIKIIDFGLATKYLSSEYKKMTARVGTIYSMAPQVLQGVYDSKCDLWSIGVIAYILLSGPKQQQPFYGPPREMSWEKRRKIMMDRIMRCEYMKMQGPSWTNVSSEAKDFVASLLQMDPSKRPTAQKALEMPWIVKQNAERVKRQAHPTLGNPPCSIPAQSSLYKKKRALERIAPMVIANELTGNEIVSLKQVLETRYDTAKRNTVTLEQFQSCYVEFVKKMHPEDDVSPVFITDPAEDSVAESASSIAMDYMHLLHEALDRRLQKLQEKLLHIFPQTEKDASASIPCEELRTVLAEHDGTLDSTLDTLLKGFQDSIPYNDISKRLRELYFQKMDHVCLCHTCDKDGDYANDNGDKDDVDLDNLADAGNSVIPGGQNDPSDSDRIKYTYDESTKSLRL